MLLPSGHTWPRAGASTVLAAAVLIAGCAGAAAPAGTSGDQATLQATATGKPPVQVASGGKTAPGIDLRKLLANPAPYLDKPLQLQGRFAGWNGSCPGSPPVSRSDWMLEQDGACLYVNGPLPTGVQPANPSPALLLLQGTLKQTRDGRLFLELAR